MKLAPEFYPPSHNDKEYFDFMMKKSESARACYNSFKQGEFFQHAAFMVDLVKIGYTRDELYAFFRVMYEQVEQGKSND